MRVQPRLVTFGAFGAVVVMMATALAAQQMVITTTGGPGPILGAPGLAGGAPPKPLEVGTGLIFGQTVDGTSSRPVPGVLVTLTVSGSIPVRVLSDSDGHYTFREVPKGGYSVSATKPGYSDGGYGRLRPDGPTQALQVTDGQRMTDVQLPMWKLGTIAGTVVDETGEPIVGTAVRVLQRTVVGGKRQWQTAATETTDDRGMYRVGGLVPGDYIVALPMTPPTSIDALLAGLGLPGGPGGGGGGVAFSATYAVSGSSGGGSTTRIMSSGSGPSAGPAGVTEDGHELWYQTTFYPTALSSAHADVMRVKAGEERGGVDFTVKAVRTVNVAGTLLGADGPAASTAVTLVPAEAGDLVTPIETATTVTDGTGHFEFTRVPAGQYSLRAVKNARISIGGDTQTIQMGGGTMVFRQVIRTSGASVPPLPTEPTFWIEAPVNVGSADITDLTMSMRTGVKVSGHVEFNGSATRPTPDQYPAIGVTLIPADGRPSAAPGRGRVEPSGSFTTVGVPAGKYVLQVNAPSGWVLRSAGIGGRDISDAPIDLRDGDIDNVTITFTDRKTSLTGEVTTASGNPDGKATVIVFPQDASLWTDSGPSPRRLRNARTGSDGTYTVALPAGDYNVIAVSDTGAFEWNDPQFLAAIAPLATRLSVTEGDTRHQPLRTSAPPTISGGLR